MMHLCLILRNTLIGRGDRLTYVGNITLPLKSRLVDCQQDSNYWVVFNWKQINESVTNIIIIEDIGYLRVKHELDIFYICQADNFIYKSNVHYFNTHTHVALIFDNLITLHVIYVTFFPTKAKLAICCQTRNSNEC